MCGEFCNVDINFTVSSNRLVGKIASLFATAKGNNSEFLLFRTHASTVVLLPFFVCSWSREIRNDVTL